MSVDNIKIFLPWFPSYSEGDGRSEVHKETEPALERQVPSLQEEGQAVDVQKSLLTEESTDECPFDVY